MQYALGDAWQVHTCCKRMQMIRRDAPNCEGLGDSSHRCSTQIFEAGDGSPQLWQGGVTFRL